MVCSPECTFPVIHEIEIWTNSSHENHATLPSLPNGGKVRLGMKAEFLLFLEPNMPDNRRTPAFDLSASVLQMLKYGSSNTFQECADTVFSPYRLEIACFGKKIFIHKREPYY